VAVCALERADEKMAAQVVMQMRDDPGTGEAATLFSRLGSNLAQKWGAKFKPADLPYARDSEEAAGFLLHGLAQWYFGDPARAADFLQFFFDSMPTVRAAAGALTGTAEWLPAYAQSFEQRYRPDLEAARDLLGLEAPKEAAAVQAMIERLESTLTRLRTQGALKSMLEKRLQALRREEVRQRMVDREKEQEELRARRQRELEQLRELDELLPALVQGYDYRPALEVLSGIVFQSSEVRSAQEARIYLRSQAQAFMEQVSRDIATKEWSGSLRRIDGATVRGVITRLDLNETLVTVERGAATMPTAQLSPETLVEIAQSRVAEVTDSTDYYRRQELIAVFARLNGLQAVSAAVAASLMEENRDFRMRWLKVL